jgi:hypothetical protein
MRQVIFAILAGLAILGTAMALYVVINPSETRCYALFDSSDDARAAAAEAVYAGFDDADIHERDNRTGATFTTGETGDDAAHARKGFARFVEMYGGRVGNPGDGCSERQALGG